MDTWERDGNQCEWVKGAILWMLLCRCRPRCLCRDEGRLDDLGVTARTGHGEVIHLVV